MRRVEAKIAAWTFLPVGELEKYHRLFFFEENLFFSFGVENGESIQVLRYNYNEKYESHFDYFYDEENKQQGGHRMATVLMYLSDVEKGGETVFPNSAVSRLFFLTVAFITWYQISAFISGKRG